MSTAEIVHFSWERHPAAAQLIQQIVEQAKVDNGRLRDFAGRLLCEAGTRLFDLVDHLVLPLDDPACSQLAQAGFTPSPDGRAQVWEHPGALLPRVRVEAAASRKIVAKVESVSDFLATHAIDERTMIDGEPGASLRQALVRDDSTATQSATEFWIVERHGDRGFAPSHANGNTLVALLHHGEHFRRRQRSFGKSSAGFDHARQLIHRASEVLGVDRSCDLFFHAEREYWQNRNQAAQMQKIRQDRLGIGWANHDHHTYRSGRECFALLIEALELLGFVCRERFYAGQEAGWGAQVLEQPQCGIVVFADVDLSPDEIAGDFAHQPLPPRQELGTVGLWCELHGEAFLEAGLHHLECQFAFEDATEQLAADGVSRMAPFTDFEHLKQAFTAGERWRVAEARLERALAKGWIDGEQAANFRREGAIGSHLEILERNDGYKGFNQTGISDIILQTDPRRV